MKNTFTDPLLKRPPISRNLRALIMRISQVYILILTTAIISVAKPGSGQSIETTEVKLEIQNEPLTKVFSEIEKQTDFLFSWAPGKVRGLGRVSLAQGKYTVKEALEIVLQGRGLCYKQEENYVLVFGEGDSPAIGHESLNEKKINVDHMTKDLAALVTGTVKDAATQEPLAGVNIIVKGTTKGTTTDVEGNFGIEVEANDILVFSFIGFMTFETQVSGRSAIEVILTQDTQSLQEVEINAGYWQVKERLKTGSISRVSAEEIRKQPVSNPLQAIQGRMPGVFIKQVTGTPGSPFQIMVRGVNSLSSGNNPLYVIDGVPFISESLSHSNTAFGRYGTSGVSPLYNINPDDIESIEILKDADATAIYGSRGANGVVLITTKKGKTGKATLDLNVYSGVSKVARKMELLNTQEYLDMRNEALKNDGPAALADLNNPAYAIYFPDLKIWDATRYTDWQEELIGGTAHITNVQGTVSGGNQQTQFLFSGGYQNQGTVFPSNEYAEKYSSHFSISHESPNDKFDIKVTSNYNLNNSNLAGLDITDLAMKLAPNAPRLYNDEGDLNWENSTWNNPLAGLRRRFDARTYNFISNASLGYKLFRTITLNTRIGINDIRNQEKSITPSTVQNPALGVTPANSSLFYNDASNRSLILEPQINWDTNINASKLSLVVGGTFQNQLRESQLQLLSGFPSNSLIEDFNSASVVDVLSYSKIKYRYAALYGRINYNWQEKYILNITGRRDGSSRFGPGNRFSNFGAVGMAWIFSDEGFVKSFIPPLSFGKIRSSYGITGNDQIGDYVYLDTYQSSGSYLGVTGLNPIRLFNPDYSWETNHKFELALELGFLNDRLFFTSAYYRNRSSNQLVDYKLSEVTGFTSITKNFPATVQNSGLEFELRTVNIDKVLKWTTSLNLTLPRNKLVRFPNLASSSYANTYVVGRSLNIRKVYNYLGIDPTTGLYQFNDMNGDGALNVSDRLSPVENIQKYFGGLSNSLTYKGWQFDIFFQFVKQNGLNHLANFNPPGTSYNQPRSAIEDRWIGAESEAKSQVLSGSYNAAAMSAYSMYVQSDAVWSDASFIRVKNISISYLIPSEWIKQIKGRLYIQGQNLLTITKYDGLDPENTSTGILPPLRTITMGIQLTY